jgi:hypothetical protein
VGDHLLERLDATPAAELNTEPAEVLS